MDVFTGCSRMGFPVAQIIACFGLEAAKIVRFDHGWTKLTIFRCGNSLLGPANALGTRRLARLTIQSPMLGSVDALEPGFRPGARWGGSGAPGALACAGGVWHARGPGARWGSGACWGLWRAGGLACAGARRMRGLWRARVPGFPWRLTRSRLRLGRCCGLRAVAGLPACGGECHVLLRSYVVGVHWVRAYACVALGEWRTDAASEEVYVGAGGGIASVA